jgi:hypothetical protein
VNVLNVQLVIEIFIELKQTYLRQWKDDRAKSNHAQCNFPKNHGRKYFLGFFDKRLDFLVYFDAFLQLFHSDLAKVLINFSAFNFIANFLGTASSSIFQSNFKYSAIFFPLNFVAFFAANLFQFHRKFFNQPR